MHARLTWFDGYRERSDEGEVDLLNEMYVVVNKCSHPLDTLTSLEIDGKPHDPGT